jgi:hypothetical protein
MRLEDGWIAVALVSVAVASLWHPFGRSRSQARAAGYRLALMGGLLLAQIALELAMGSHPVNGPIGATCPNTGTLWRAAGIALTLTLWAGVGVLKGSLRSLLRHEDRFGASIGFPVLAGVFGFVGIFAWLAPALCDYS